VFRFWRWLTCERGHHRWTIGFALPLDTPATGTDSGYGIAVRVCRRCGLIWELE
jgi:hypothetical protein